MLHPHCRSADTRGEQVSSQPASRQVEDHSREMSFEEIARRLGISKARAWQLYRSGMSKLRRGRAEHLRRFICDERGKRGLA